MISRMSSPKCGGFSIGPTRSSATSFMFIAPILSVIVYQVHDLAVLEAEHHAPVARSTETLLARAVALDGMQP